MFLTQRQPSVVRVPFECVVNSGGSSGTGRFELMIGLMTFSEIWAQTECEARRLAHGSISTQAAPSEDLELCNVYKLLSVIKGSNFRRADNCHHTSAHVLFFALLFVYLFAWSDRIGVLTTTETSQGFLHEQLYEDQMGMMPCRLLSLLTVSAKLSTQLLQG